MVIIACMPHGYFELENSITLGMGSTLSFDTYQHSMPRNEILSKERKVVEITVFNPRRKVFAAA